MNETPNPPTLIDKAQEYHDEKVAEKEALPDLSGGPDAEPVIETAVIEPPKTKWWSRLYSKWTNRNTFSESSDFSEKVVITLDPTTMTPEDLTQAFKRIKSIMDINNDKKINWEDVKAWAWLIFQSLLYGIILAAWFNRFELWDAFQSGIFFTDSIWSGLGVSALRFAYNGAKQTLKKENQGHVETIKEKDKKIDDLTKELKISDGMLVDTVTSYENELFLRNYDLAGKNISIVVKDNVARQLIKKNDKFREIFKAAHPLRAIEILTEEELDATIPQAP